MNAEDRIRALDRRDLAAAETLLEVGKSRHLCQRRSVECCLVPLLRRHHIRLSNPWRDAWQPPAQGLK